MTFDDITQEIADRLDLTSARSLARIGRSVNERYRAVATSVSMPTVGRTTVTADTVIGNQSVTFEDVDKLYSVYDTDETPYRVLKEATIDELRNSSPGIDPARRYAIENMGATTVTIRLDSIPESVYELGADANGVLSTLEDSDEPAFAAAFHDILVYGGMATELDHMEKYEFAKKQEYKYEQRLSELRYFIAKSAYADIHQGKNI